MPAAIQHPGTRPQSRFRFPRPLPLLFATTALRFGGLRGWDVPARTDRQPVRAETVTYVPGM